MVDTQSPVYRFKVWRASLPQALRLLLTINMVVYAAWVILRFVGPVREFVLAYLALHPVLPDVLVMPWQLVTYGFLNLGASIWGLIGFIFAMLWLYWMGRDYEEFYGAHRLFGLYILCTLLGALFAIAFFSLFGGSSEVGAYISLGGAWPAAIGVLCCVATLNPNRGLGLLFLGVVPLKWIAIGFVAIDVLFGFDPTHLGGAAMGALFGLAQKQHVDFAAWARPFFNGSGGRRGNVSRSAGSRLKAWTSSTPSVSSSSKKTSRDSGFGKAVGTQAEVDRILDKILEKGYDSLTEEEKTILNDASKRS